MSFPRFLPRQQDSRTSAPLWIDTKELFDSHGEFRRPDLAQTLAWATERRDGFRRARAANLGEGKCLETGVGGHSSSTIPLLPSNMAHLEVLAAAIIHGTIVGTTTGFLRGRPVTLFEIDVIDVLKGADIVAKPTIVYLFWPEVRFQFGTFCLEWAVGGWPLPPPEMGREVLLTPNAMSIETVAYRPVIVVWYGVGEVIYEIAGGLSAPLSPTRFPEIFSGASKIRELEIVRRLRAQRHDGY
jgi:hypothetical protein